MRIRLASLAAPLLLAGTLAAGCSSDDAGSSGPTIVVTTSILGDVVENIVGDDADVEVLMPAGVDPHEFQLSAQQAAKMQEADLIVANGLGFEAGLEDAVGAARDAGVPVYEVAPDLDPLPLNDGADGRLDPHVFTDPARMAEGVGHIADTVADAVPALDTPEMDERAAAYAEQVQEADLRAAAKLARIPEADRVLVTNHDLFGYFADRYDFEVVGAVIPGGGTLSAPSAQELAGLADVIREQDVPAIFADASSPTDLADVLAAENGVDVQVVPLHSESLGEPGSGADTYLSMIQANAIAVADALGRSGPP